MNCRFVHVERPKHTHTNTPRVAVNVKPVSVNSKPWWSVSTLVRVGEPFEIVHGYCSVPKA